MSLADLIRWGGYTVLVAIVFCETGLLVGFFLPGDSLLITAGRLAAGGTRGILWVDVPLSGGPRLFPRETSLLFNRRHLIRTREFYERYGGKTIVIARFVPIIRTFAPVVAGGGQMRYARFVFYNVFGGIAWVASMTWAGYLLGSVIPNISSYVHVVVGAVIVLSVVPIAVEVLRARRRGAASGVSGS